MERKSIILSLLLGVFTVNFMDRQILAILAQSIKVDLALSDTQIGLLYGAAFALLYATAGIPIARYADRSNRARVVNWSLVIFSVMSAACGIAANYGQLMTARIGVAIGEGGTNPPSHSMISDLYPFDKRSTAMAVFSLGPHIGLLLGFVIGGWAGQIYGWRAAFLIAGIIGLIFAVPSFLYLREPPREQPDPTTESASFRAVILAMTSLSSARHLLIGLTIYSVAGYSVIGWLPALLIRSSGLGAGAIGSILALVIGLAGAFGTFFGGAFADRLGKSEPSWRLRVVAIVLVLVTPFWAAVFLSTHTTTMIALIVLPGMLLGFHFGPTFAMIQSLVAPSMRATAAAVLLFFANVIGLGLGPLVVGALSDALAGTAGVDSLRYALLVVPPLCLWAAYHYDVASRDRKSVV